MAPTDDDAQAVSHTIPGRLAAGWSYNVAVTMLNTGISTWTRDGKGPPDGSQGYKLGAKSGLLLPFDTRILLPPDVNVASQDSHDFEFEILAPFETGVYCAVLQMIHGEVWFGQPLEVCVEIGIGPVVTDITPASGPPGTVVTISGQNFRPETEVWFSFGDPSHRAYSRVPVNYSWESPFQIAFTVPDDAGCGYHFVSLADPETPTEEGPTLVVTPPVEFVVTAPCNPARRNSFDVVSYNIRMLPDEACLIDDKDTHKCHKDYRAPLIARHPLLQDHDAIVFVEAFSDRHRSEITIMLSGEYPYVGSVLGREHWPGREDGGVIILSKWPIEWEAETVFKDRTGVDWWADKGVKYARINKAGQRYHIFGTHLDSSQNEGDRAVRTLQLRQMASFIKEQSLAIGEAVLMAGDFNIDRNGKSGPFYSEYERMLTTLNASQPPIQGFHFSTNPDGQWLDYVLYSNTHLQPGRSGNLVLMPRDGAGGDLSDHYAVLGSFVFSIPENLAVDFSKAPTETPTGGGPPGTVGTPSPIFSWDEVAGADSNALDLTQRR